MARFFFYFKAEKFFTMLDRNQIKDQTTGPYEAQSSSRFSSVKMMKKTWNRRNLEFRMKEKHDFISKWQREKEGETGSTLFIANLSKER